MKTARYKAHLEILCGVIIWGVASVVIKETLKGIHPVPFLTYRFLLSSLVAILGLPSLFRLFKKTSLLPLILVYCFLSATVGLGILFLGLEKTSVVNLSLIQAIHPLFLAYLGHKFFHDHLSKRAKIGIFIALTGAAVTLVEPFLKMQDTGTAEGNLLLLVYIISDIVGILLLKDLLKKKVDPLSLTNFSFILAFLIFGSLTILHGDLINFFQTITHLEIKYHVGVWYMAFLSGTLAYTLRARAQKTLTVTETSILGYLSPIISTFLAIIFLSEAITPLFLCGAALIGAGVVLVEYKRSRGNR